MKKLLFSIIAFAFCFPLFGQAVKLSDLPAASTPDGTEIVPAVQGGTTKKMTVAQINNGNAKQTSGYFTNGFLFFSNSISGEWGYSDTNGHSFKSNFFSGVWIKIANTNIEGGIGMTTNFQFNALSGLVMGKSLSGDGSAISNVTSSGLVGSGFGSSTNQYLRDAVSTNLTIVSGVWKPTNTWIGIGTIGGAAGTSVITNDTPGAFTRIHAGDNFAAGNLQLTVQWVNNPSNIIVFETLQMPWSKSNYIVYPNAQYGTDINGSLVVTAVGNDGTLSVIGRYGGNSGTINWMSDLIGGAWKSQISSSGSWTLGTKGNNGGGIITINTNAIYESLDIFPDSSAGFRSVTNSGVSGLGFLPIYGRVVIGNSSSDVPAGNGLTVKSNIQITIGQFIGNGGGLTNLSATAIQSIIIQTNVISGQLYTNNYGSAIEVKLKVGNTVAAVSGASDMALMAIAAPANGGWTNDSAYGTTIGVTIAMTYTNTISVFVPTNAIWCATNFSSGAGNAASVIGGQIKYP